MCVFKFNGETIEPGTKYTILIPLPALPNGALISLPVSVLHGKRAGPTAWISAAIHGDELCVVFYIQHGKSSNVKR